MNKKIEIDDTLEAHEPYVDEMKFELRYHALDCLTNRRRADGVRLLGLSHTLKDTRDLMNIKVILNESNNALNDVLGKTKKN